MPRQVQQRSSPRNKNFVLEIRPRKFRNDIIEVLVRELFLLRLMQFETYSESEKLMIGCSDK